MHPISTQIARRTIPELGRAVVGRTGIRDWLAGGAYRADLDADDEQRVIISEIDIQTVLCYLAFDYTRFGLAGIESYHCTIEHKSETNHAWPLIQLYYSAYYFAHSLMRACGVLLVRLNRERVRKLRDILSLFVGSLPELSSGEYLFRIERIDASDIQISIEKLVASGGAHELFWREFSGFLTEIESDVVQNSRPGRNEFIGALSDLNSYLRAAGSESGSWLSVIRNEITYQHGHGVWLPTSRKEPAVSAVRGFYRRTADCVPCSSDPRKNPILAFSDASQLIVEVGIEVASRLASESKRSGSFGRRWNTALERLNSIVA